MGICCLGSQKGRIFLSSNQATVKPETDAFVREIYRPILRGYFAVFATYYLIMLPLNITYGSIVEMAALIAATTVAACVASAGTWYFRNPIPARHMDLWVTTLNIVVIFNVVIALQTEFASEKLVYFIMMAFIFALASVNFRHSIFSIVATGLALASFVPLLDASELFNYGFLCFGGALASLSIAYFLRRQVTNVASAKIKADEELESAQQIGEEMRQRSLSDSLTQLPNRRAFFARLREAIRDTDAVNHRDQSKLERVWLLLLDLDGFKAINDIHGHLSGDQLLKQVAGRLEMFAGSDMFVSRVGGDEFNLIFVSSESEEEIMARCKHLLDLVAATYVIDGRHMRVSCSIGCKAMEPGKSSRTQLSQADFALIIAKKQGKNRAVLFNHEHAKQAEARYEIEEALRVADLREEIDLVFQPQIGLGANTVHRAEALARWTSPKIGKVGPQRFIKIAEESGLITGITIVVMEKALATLKSWDEPIPLSINLSAHDLISDPTIEQIITMISEADIAPHMIEFEVTETAMMADFTKAAENLNRLAQMGLSIALDDFGTGYSNFSYLRSLPIEKLKIDKSFVENPGDPMTEKILASLSGMARVLGVHCLLEGVEDEVELLMAKRAGAESVQGYFFGKPMSADELVELARNSVDQAALKAASN